MIPTEINFASTKQYRELKEDVTFWSPMIQMALNKGKDTAVIAGFNSTYPVFLVGDLVIKFFGYRENWEESFINECLAHECLKLNDQICAPKILNIGQLYENITMPWKYIVSTRIKGHSWLQTDLTYNQKKLIVAELGKQLGYIHSLPLNYNLKNDKEWHKLDLKSAARKSSLPGHLIDQIDDFIGLLDTFDKVFVNSDIVPMHVFIENGHLSGIIDWGDSVVADRHYEVAKLCLSLFPCDKVLLKILINAANWPVTDNFQVQTLGLALYRQAVGLTQHHSFDVFYQLPIDMKHVKTLEELAHVLFDLD